MNPTRAVRTVSRLVLSVLVQGVFLSGPSLTALAETYPPPQWMVEKIGPLLERHGAAADLQPLRDILYGSQQYTGKNILLYAVYAGLNRGNRVLLKTGVSQLNGDPIYMILERKSRERRINFLCVVRVLAVDIDPYTGYATPYLREVACTPNDEWPFSR